MALGCQKREAHAAADHERVHLRQQRVDDSQLVADLGAAEHDDVGPLRGDREPVQDRDLGHHEWTGSVREPQRDVIHAGVFSVDRPEGVVHVGVRKGGEAVGELAALLVVRSGLRCFEADVLQQAELPIAQCADRLPRCGTSDVGGEGHRLTEQLTESLGDRAQGVRRVRPAPRPTQMGEDDDPGAACHQVAQQGTAGPDAPVVGDGPVPERDVEVRADKDRAAPQLTQGVEGPHEAAAVLPESGPTESGPDSFEPTSTVRSASRLL